jgi:hypothetical protein
MNILRHKFPRRSKVKIKEEIFICPQIRKVIQVSMFEAALN